MSGSDKLFLMYLALFLAFSIVTIFASSQCDTHPGYYTKYTLTKGCHYIPYSKEIPHDD